MISKRRSSSSNSNNSTDNIRTPKTNKMPSSVLTPNRKRKSDGQFVTQPIYPITPMHDCSILNENRTSPIPPLTFASCTEIWDLMCKMDIKYKKNPDLLKNHPVLSPQMRAILFDWLMDVCEAYNLHRETLHLAIDYLDRYLDNEHEILKQSLQLIGITCLFVASKIEEIYPPKLKVFAYVTDGACTEEDILSMEIVLMKTLKWQLNPITPPNWLNIYLQVLSINGNNGNRPRDFLRTLRTNQNIDPEDSKLIKPKYAGVDFVRCVRIVDLASFEIESLKYSYSTLAAAALYHIKGRQAALTASGFSWEFLAPCINWLSPFAQITKKYDVPDVLPGISGIADEARHLIQSHCATLKMLEEVQLIANSHKVCSPLVSLGDGGILTPPKSSEKTHKKRGGKH